MGSWAETCKETIHPTIFTAERKTLSLIHMLWIRGIAGGGCVADTPGSTGQWVAKLLSQINGNSTNDYSFLKFIMSVRSGHCYHVHHAPKNLATTLL
jgi:hypothetical protein